MALVSSSQNVTDQSATPIVKVNPLKKGGVIRSAIGNILAANFVGGTTGQWYTFVRIPVRARVVGIYLTGATTTTGAVKCGLYRPDGIAISDAVFSAVTLTSSEKDRVQIDVVQTSVDRTKSIADAYSVAIGTAGATGDVECDIALAIVTVLGASVDHMLEVEYVLPE